MLCCILKLQNTVMIVELGFYQLVTWLDADLTTGKCQMPKQALYTEEQDLTMTML